MTGRFQNLASIAKQRVAIDTRSLAVFRILVGLLILIDVVLRSRNLVLFYTDYGLTPRHLMREEVPGSAFSFHFISGEPEVILLLFVLQTIFAIQLIIGYKTRVAMFICFLFIISVDYRNVYITSYADTIFRLLLFWALFLPLGERWSIDARRREREPQDTIASLASLFILLQMILMYFVNGWHKTEYHEYWMSGEAMILLLHYERVTFFLAEYLLYLPSTLIQLGGIVWYGLLIFSGILILVIGRTRYCLALMFISVHLTLGVSVRIGAFSFVCITGLILFFQKEFWQDLANITPSEFISVQSICSKSLEIIDKDLQAIESCLGTILVPFRTIYTALNTVENYSTPIKTCASILLICFLLLAGIYMIIPNVQTTGILLDEDEPVVLQNQTESVQETFRLQQPSWSFFTSPRHGEVYYVMAGETKTGDKVDLLNDRNLTLDRPYEGNFEQQFETYRHRFYFGSVPQRSEMYEYSGTQKVLAEFYCQEGVPNKGDELKHINFYHIDEQRTLETVGNPDDYNRTAGIFAKFPCDREDEPTEILDNIENKTHIDDYEDFTPLDNQE